MNNRNQRRKRHPLVRLLRSILRLIRAVFKPKQRRSRPIDRGGNFDRLPAENQQVSRDLPIVTEQISIGNFDRLPAENQQVSQDLPLVTEQISVVIAPAIATQDFLLETIGELFDRIQWQMLPATIPVKVSAPVQAVRTNLASPSGASLETVGELLDRVKWHPTTTIQEQVTSTRRMLQTHDVSLN